MSNYLPLDVTFVSGDGCWLTDKSGKQYLDALSGVGVVNQIGRASCRERV